jgi:hypothetical protein
MQPGAPQSHHPPASVRPASATMAYGLGFQTTLMAHLEISVIKSLNGDHKSACALSRLENLSVLVNILPGSRSFG